MIFGFLIPIAVITFLILGIRRLRANSASEGFEGQSVRRFFQYLILFGLLIVSGTGLAGLLSRLLDQSAIIYADKTDLARNVSYIIVGIPLFLVIGLWTKRQRAADPREAASFGWAMYFTLASVTSLLLAMTSLHQVLTWGFASGDYSSHAFSQFIIWGAIWGALWKIDSKFTFIDNTRLHHIAGSLIGLVTVVIGLSGLLSGAFERIFRTSGDVLFLAHSDSMTKGVITLLVGLPIWILYWIVNTSKSMKDSLWLAYVLLLGVAGGLTMAMVASSTAIYNALVWFFGDPSTSERSIHFRNSPTYLAVALVGASVWWYHRTIALHENPDRRSEVRRIYEYLMAGIGLLACSTGFSIVIIAFIESLTRSHATAGNATSNTLLGAATLLVVGFPLWWAFWRRIQAYVINSPSEEHSSPTRRIYLFLVFGVGGVAAIITLLTGVYFLFSDLFNGNFGSETFHRMRIPIGLLIAAGAVAGYHWSIYRIERELLAEISPIMKYILLLGPRDPELASEIARISGAKVQFWIREDHGDDRWAVEEVMNAIATCKSRNIIVLSELGVLKAIPFERK